MEMRLLGRSGLRVSALSFGTMTFGGESGFEAVGSTQVDEARRLIDICQEHGVNLFDTADVYSRGRSEEILGEALQGRRDQVLIATKAFGRMGELPNDAGLSRHHLVKACEASLRRLRTDYIDLYQVHLHDALTPIDETLRALDDLVRAGKVRYVGCSNYGGWQLMRALATSERLGLNRFVSQQIYYSLVGRDSEFDLVPLGLAEGVGILVWSPLAFGLLSGKFRRDQPMPEGARRTQMGDPNAVDMEMAYRVIDTLDAIARERGATPAQVALGWLLRRAGVSSVIIGARNEAQLRDNLASASWSLSDDEMRRLTEASDRPLIYPYWHQKKYGLERNPD